MAEFKLAIGPVLVHEGGYVNDPHDPGGATNYGISLRWLRKAGQLDLDRDGLLDGDFDNDGDVDIDDIKKMTVNDAMKLYEHHWWRPYPYEAVNIQKVATKVFDTAINMGTPRAVKIAQHALNAWYAGERRTAVDGVFGRETLALLNRVYGNGESYLSLYAGYQMDHYNSIIHRNAKLAKFKNGWRKRAHWY